MATEIKLVSQFAQFTVGDIKGGAYAQSYRITVITQALEQLFKGNYEPIKEAAAHCEGKSKKARAYAAGFAALGAIGSDAHATKVDYIGKLADPVNKPAREEIAKRTDAALARFFVAFDAVMAEKTEKKAAAPAAAAPAAAAAALATNTASVEVDSELVTLDVAEVVRAALAVIHQNLIGEADAEALYAALAARAVAIKDAERELAATLAPFVPERVLAAA
jgi:hypothetical protein